MAFAMRQIAWVIADDQGRVLTVATPKALWSGASGDSPLPGAEGFVMIRVTPTIAIDESEVEESFIRASGPGGQNVNKVSSAVQLRFDVRRSPSLPDHVRERLERLAGRRLTSDGVIVITAQRFRTQEQNRRDALDRLIEMIRKAAMVPAVRRPTRPTAASRRERLERKTRRAVTKHHRRSVPEEE